MISSCQHGSSSRRVHCNITACSNYVTPAMYVTMSGGTLSKHNNINSYTQNLNTNISYCGSARLALANPQAQHDRTANIITDIG